MCQDSWPRGAIWKSLIAKIAILEIIFWGRFYPIGICYFNFGNKDVLRVLGFELPTKSNILWHLPCILEYFPLVFPPVHCHLLSLVVTLVFPSFVLHWLFCKKKKMLLENPPRYVCPCISLCVFPCAISCNKQTMSGWGSSTNTFVINSVSDYDVLHKSFFYIQ